MATLLATKPNNKYASKLNDKKCKNKHRDGDAEIKNRRWVKKLILREARLREYNIEYDYNQYGQHHNTRSHQNTFNLISYDYSNEYIPIWQCPLCTYINITTTSITKRIQYK